MTTRWLKDAFAKFDVDQNGALSLSEVENLLHGLNIDMDSKLLKMLFNVSFFQLHICKCSLILLMLTNSLNHSRTDSLTHSLAHSLTYSFTHSLTDSLIHSLTHLLTHSLTNSLELPNASPAHYTLLMCFNQVDFHQNYFVPFNRKQIFKESKVTKMAH